MDNSSQLLDQGLISESKPLDIEINLASAGKRFANYLIDFIVFLVIMFLTGVFLGMLGAADGQTDFTWNILAYLIYVFYYFVMEASTGKSIAKMITGTKVVNMEGGHISVGQAIGRALCRLIPFEQFSFLGSTAVGWHDSIPKTRVING